MLPDATAPSHTEVAMLVELALCVVIGGAVVVLARLALP
jgi:hypothetical protein